MKILYYGELELLDVMGTDASIAASARISYGKKTEPKSSDKDLINYLWRHGHHSPFEMAEMLFYVKAPIFVFRQWHRHRTACVGPDCTLDFDLPAGTKNSQYKHYPRTVGEFFSLWKNGIHHISNKHKQRECSTDNIDNNYTYTLKELSIISNRSISTLRELCNTNKITATKIGGKWYVLGGAFIEWLNKPVEYFIDIKDRLQQMKLRQLNEETHEIQHTTIKDIWSNGVKKIYRVILSNNNAIEVTKDHLFYTEVGWLKLNELYDFKHKTSKYKVCTTIPCGDNIAYEVNNTVSAEIWKYIEEYGDRYKISNTGRVINAKTGHEKKITTTNTAVPYKIVTLCMNGVCKTFHIHRLLLDTFYRKKIGKEQCRHIDGNSLNNSLSNLMWGTAAENSSDKKLQNGVTTLRTVFIEVVECLPIGEKETYDIEVTGDFHNFSCNGFIIHNSINEMSGRYTELSEEFYIPEEFRQQSINNKQGSSDKIIKCTLLSPDIIKQDYKHLLSKGVAREQARIILPVATYSEMYWKCDLRNILNFLKLRLDKHAQTEIREYAIAMADFVKKEFPFSYSAFENHTLNSITLSEYEIKLIKENKLNPEKWAVGKREKAEIVEKFKLLGLL